MGIEPSDGGQEVSGRGQSYVESVPLPSLGDLVRAVWVQRTGTEPYVQRNLPTGGVELQCRIGSVPRLVGPLRGPSVEVLPPRTTVIGIRFRPGVAGSVLGHPASELVDLTIGLDEVWGSAAVDLGEAVASARSPEAALRIVQDRLVGRRAVGTSPDPLVTEAVRRLLPWRTARIDALSSDLAISESQLRRRCLAAAGIAPKALQRILRFQGFVALVQSTGMRSTTSDGVGLAQLAAAAGYADHAHLSRECAGLTGMPPRAFLDDATRRCRCGHDHNASFGPFLAALTPRRPTRA